MDHRQPGAGLLERNGLLLKVRVLEVNDDEFRDLVEAAHLIGEMQQHPGWIVWRNHLTRRIDAKKREMLAGKESLEAYRYLAGWIEAMEYAVDSTGELAKWRDREAKRRKEAKAAT